MGTGGFEAGLLVEGLLVGLLCFGDADGDLAGVEALAGLSRASQSSSSFLVSTTPGTRIGAEHFGQVNFWPASFDGARRFFWHFGHAKLSVGEFASDKTGLK